MEGWVKFHRKIEEWEWYTDSNTFRVFFHLVLKANHKPNKWRGVDIDKGQLITSRDKLAEQLNLSVQQVRTSLKKLEKTKEITIKATNKYTLVTIENYTIYQTKEEKVTSKTTNEQPSNNHQVTTNKNEKNERMKEYTNNKELFDTLIDYNSMRVKIKKPMTLRALNGILNKLDKLASTDEQKILILEQSIEKCYTGVFEVSNGYNNQTKQTSKTQFTDLSKVEVKYIDGTTL